MPETLPLFADPDAPVTGEYIPPGRRPRPYQLEALNEWKRQRLLAWGHLMVLFCGAGKTFIAGRIAGEEKGRVLFLVNRSKLADQSLNKLPEDSGRRWQLEQAECRASADGNACVVATVQSLKGDRLKRFSPDAFSLIIVDEVHMMMGASYRAPLEYFTGARRLGLTATPDRKRKKKNGEEVSLGYRGLFDNLVYKKTLADAIDEGWSTPLETRIYESEVDLSAVKFRDGDFEAGALDQAILEAVAPVKEACFTKCDDLRTVVFCPGVKSAIAVADALNAERPGCARVIYGEQDDAEKKRNMADHAAGLFQFLVNCMILTVGYDDEQLQCIVDAAPTSVRSLAEQKFGRPARLWPGIGEIHDDTARKAAIAASPKPWARVVDLAFNSRHPLATPEDVLGGHYTDDVRKQARKNLAKHGGDVAKALKAAAEDIAARQARARASKEARAKLREVKAPTEPPRKTDAGEDMLMLGQERQLSRYGIPYDKNTTKATAKRLIGSEFVRATRFTGPDGKPLGWAPKEHVAFARKYFGIQCTEMSLHRYRACREVYMANGKRPLTPEQILITARIGR